MFRNGFTLIELCVSSAILAISLMLAIPKTTQLEEESEFRSCVSEIYQLIQHAKTLAVIDKQPLWLFFQNESGSSDWMLTLSDNSSLSKGIKLSSIDSSSYPHLLVKGAYLDNKMAFYQSRGKVSSGNIIIQSRHHPERKVKLLSSYGAARIRLCSLGENRAEWPQC